MGVQIELDGTGLEQIRKAVRNMRRRYILYYLHHSGGAARIDELVDRVATWEHGSAAGDVPGRKRDSVYSSLYQTHLPKLEQIGLVRYDDDDKTVSITEAGERVTLRCAANGAPDCKYLGLIVGLDVLVLALFALRQLGFLATQTFFGLSAALIAGLSLVALRQLHVVRSWKRRYWRRGPDYILDVDDN
ncbi:DUF7344 domain-containing protein [Halomicrobium urmianum]|uniref:DUF7344 domain-containing protein n=1 Tax=Halomicrobium urmianum TaxID=1586233 RepID=UPI001CD939B9|nr:hypothetical protein [Halomicrobium urmianum]